MGYALRQPADDDWPAIRLLVDRAVPENTVENDRWLENRRRYDESGYPRRHYVALDVATGAIAGYGGVEGVPEPGLFRVFLVTSPALLADGLGLALFDRLRDDLAALGARRAYLVERVRETELLAFFEDRGFAETRRESFGDGLPCVVLESALME